MGSGAGRSGCAGIGGDAGEAVAGGAAGFAEDGPAALGVAGGLAGSCFGVGDEGGGEGVGVGGVEVQARHAGGEARAQVVGGLDEAGDEAAAQALQAAQLGELAQVGEVLLPAGEVVGWGREVAGEDALVAVHAVALARGGGEGVAVVAAGALQLAEEGAAAGDLGGVGGGFEGAVLRDR